MKVKMNLKTKMLVYILTATSIIYALALGYVSFKLNNLAFDNAKKLTQTYAREYANYTKADLNVDMNTARALAQAAMGYKNINSKDRKNIHLDMIKHLIEENPNFLSTWFNWQLKYIWPNYKKEDGRLRLTYYRHGGEIILKEEIIDTIPGFTKGAYYDILAQKRDYVMDPYYFTYAEGEEQILETSVATPIMDGGVAVGCAGIDLPLQRFQDLIKTIQPIEGSYAFLIAYNGQYVAHYHEENIGKMLSEFSDFNPQILVDIQSGKENFLSIKNQKGEDYWVSYAPVYIGNAVTPWSFGFAVPVDVIMAKERATLRNSILVGLIGLLLTAGIIWLIAINIAGPVTITTNILSDLAKGDIDESKKLPIKSQDEIGDMSQSVNTLIDGLNKTANFAKEIGKGNLDQEFELLSDKDVLGNSLLEMRKSLKLAKEQEELRKLEDQKQNWATQGLAKFAEILRQNNDDMKEFAYHIISNLVKYINANQGALFIINDDDKNDKFIELLACYAYERRKYIEKRVDMGVGVIGRSIKEQRSIYMTDLPKDYINITSGLGQAVPNALLVVPLKVNDEIYGVVELAGFNSFENHVIKFVEEVGESIAATISATKINIRTNQLLEQSQQQSEEMAAQEEEMRQNMEELQATQEESSRRSAEMQGLLNALNTANLVIEYDLEGYIISVNKNYLELIGVSKEKMIGSHHTDNMNFTKEQLQENKKFWSDLRNGIAKKETDHVLFNGREYVFVATYTPIFDEYDTPVKVLKIATDITELYHKDKKGKKS
ncbi:MAG: cache domain-containing protein [Bacteroidales bacterium]|jgi:methyl-accepting chemotaxis protein|nr:cache domain-containing protein [Bacteroidales bacterium]